MKLIAVLSQLVGAAGQHLLERAALMGSELLTLAARLRTALLLSAAALLMVWSALLLLSFSLILVIQDELRPIVGALIALTHLCAGLVLSLVAQRRFHQLHKPFTRSSTRPATQSGRMPGQG